MFWPFNRAQPHDSINTAVQKYKDPHLKQFNVAYQDITIRKSLDIKYIPKLSKYKPTKFPIVLCHGLSGFDQLLLIPSIKYWIILLKRHMELINLDLNILDSFLSLDDNNALSNDKSYFGESGKLLYPKEGLMIDYWIGIADTLTANGNDVIIAKVPPFGSIEERALALNNLIKEKTKDLINKNNKTNNQEDASRYKGYGDELNPLPINLIAHSMGGLDCRYLISKIKPTEYKILSLTTISTPHHGSEMADFVVQHFEKVKDMISNQANNKNINNNSLSLPICFYQLTTNFMDNFFNPMISNDPNVKYFSFGATFKPNWFNVFHITAQIVNERTKDTLKLNDGLVTVKSAMWGQYLGTLYGLDHLDVINWQNKLQMDLNKLLIAKNMNKDDKTLGVSTILRKSNKLNILDFYLYITQILSQNGF